VAVVLVEPTWKGLCLSGQGTTRPWLRPCILQCMAAGPVHEVQPLYRYVVSSALATCVCVCVCVCVFVRGWNAVRVNCEMRNTGDGNLRNTDAELFRILLVAVFAHFAIYPQLWPEVLLVIVRRRRLPPPSSVVVAKNIPHSAFYPRSVKRGGTLQLGMYSPRGICLGSRRPRGSLFFLAGSASPRPHTVLPRSRPYCLDLGSQALPHSFCLGLGSVWKVAPCLGSEVISQLKRASAHGAQVQV